MHKGKVNITLDEDLIEYIKSYAEKQRTTVSEIFTQFVLNLKRTVVNEPTEMILADPIFRKSLLDTISKIRTGKMKWLKYDDVRNARVQDFRKLLKKTQRLPKAKAISESQIAEEIKAYRAGR
jgi:hypothetical protein